MFTNYLKIALRSLTRNKTYSLLNTSGLAIGMTVSLLISLWTWDELSFNTYHRNFDRIAQVILGDKSKGAGGALSYPLVNELKANGKDKFKHVVTAWHAEEYILSAEDRNQTRTGQFIEAPAPEMLSLHMLKGTWSGLKGTSSVLLSASTAKALYGSADPMGKRVRINNKMEVTVTGVYQDLPLNSQFHNVQFFAPWDLYVAHNSWITEQGWDNNFLQVYVEVLPNRNIEAISASIENVELDQITRLDNMKAEVASNPEVFLLPMHDWHLHNYKDNGFIDKDTSRFVWLMGMIGGFVLLLACINFMNLSTARCEKRAKEVGIRKAIGSERSQLIYQFFIESLLVVVPAFLVCLGLVQLALPWFNQITAKQIILPWTNIPFWMYGIGFILFTTILAGSYPALYLSSFKPIQVLKGTVRAGRSATLPRKALVVLQFSVSITLIICTAVVYKQAVYGKDRPVGYSREGLLMVQLKSIDFTEGYDLLRSELKNTGVVAEMAVSGGRVTELWSNNEGFSWKGEATTMKEAINFGTLAVSHEYGKTVGWEFIKGRDFLKAFGTDSTSLVINETAAKVMGLKSPIGEQVSWKIANSNIDKHYTIIDVIRDLVMNSPYDPIKPTFFMLKGYQDCLNIRINSGVSTASALPKIEAVFKKIAPSAPFDYRFASDEYAQKFAAEERMGKLAGLAALLAVFISCLGLFGMATFVAEQRTKEIGVRKVLGASVKSLWILLSKEFVALVLVSVLIAAPLAYYFMYNWLQDYPYRTEISWWIFVASGLSALLIALTTISFQVIKAAIVNPISSLRRD